MSKLLWFVSHHGFGHAARSSAILEHVFQKNPEVSITLLSAVPEWFFADSLPGRSFRHISIPVDVGLIQLDPFRADLPQTLEKLSRFYPVSADWTRQIEESCGQMDLVVTDSSPAGLAYAAQKNIPSVLIENFTWSWLYTPYAQRFPEFIRFSDHFNALYNQAIAHIQTEPFCTPDADAFKVSPVARYARKTAEETRRQLGIQPHETMILVTLGGIDSGMAGVPANPMAENRYVISGGVTDISHTNGIVRIPHHSQFYHPDLVAAADVVIGKLGYSTIAEAAVAQKPLLFVPRRDFIESDVLKTWVEENMVSLEVSQKDLEEGRFDHLLADIPRTNIPLHKNGASDTADFILAQLRGL